MRQRSWQVAPIGSRERTECIDVLARAFRDNPAMRALNPGTSSGERQRRLERVFGGFLQATAYHGHVEVVRDEDGIVGVSLGFEAGGYPPPLRGELLLARGVLACGPRVALRFLALSTRLARHQPREARYLFFMGVAPEYQGRGVGSALLASHCEQAERSGVSAYLETDKESSVRLYERHGYAVVRKERYADLQGLELWLMSRQPGRARASD